MRDNKQMYIFYTLDNVSAKKGFSRLSILYYVDTTSTTCGRHIFTFSFFVWVQNGGGGGLYNNIKYFLLKKGLKFIEPIHLEMMQTKDCHHHRHRRPGKKNKVSTNSLNVNAHTQRHRHRFLFIIITTLRLETKSWGAPNRRHQHIFFFCGLSLMTCHFPLAEITFSMTKNKIKRPII